MISLCQTGGRLLLLSAILAVDWFFVTQVQPKPNAIWGRFGPLESLGLIGLLLATVAAILFTVFRPKKKFWFRFLATGVGFVLAWFLLEAIAWIWPIRHALDNPFFLTDKSSNVGDIPIHRPPHIHWVGQSRGDLAIATDADDPAATQVTFRTDADGFRNETDERQADILFLGDSFTEAGSVNLEETFAFRIGKALKRPIRNMGRAGLCPPAELAVLARYGYQVRPKVIVWQITEANDLEDTSAYLQWLGAGRPRYVSADSRGLPTRQEAWRRRSPSLTLFRLFATPEVWSNTGVFLDANQKRWDVRFLWMPSQWNSPINNPNWPAIETAIERGNQLLDADMILLHIPMKSRVLGELVEPPFSRRIGPNWDHPTEATLAYALAQLALKLGVDFVDGRPPLLQKAKEGVLPYLPMDTHLSGVGHQVVAETLTPLVKSALERVEKRRTNARAAP